MLFTFKGVAFSHAHVDPKLLFFTQLIILYMFVFFMSHARKNVILVLESRDCEKIKDFIF